MIPRRQVAVERDDLLLASWFGGGETSAGDDQVFDILSGKRKSDTVEFVSWETPEDLETVLPQVLRNTLQFSPNDSDSKALELSLGGENGEARTGLVLSTVTNLVPALRPRLGRYLVPFARNHGVLTLSIASFILSTGVNRSRTPEIRDAIRTCPAPRGISRSSTATR